MSARRASVLSKCIAALSPAKPPPTITIFVVFITCLCAASSYHVAFFDPGRPEGAWLQANRLVPSSEGTCPFPRVMRRNGLEVRQVSCPQFLASAPALEVRFPFNLLNAIHKEPRLCSQRANRLGDAQSPEIRR